MKYLMKYLLLIITLSVSILSSNRLVAQPKKLGGRSHPSFSPDGRLIACKLGNRLAIMKRDGSNKRLISQLVWDDSPSWSPDGKRIVFQSYGHSLHKSKFAIWVINSDGTKLQRLIEPSQDGDQYPRWSPNGRQIAWTHGKQLWIIDTNGHNAHPLTSKVAKAFELMGDWSPDGKTIVYLREDSYSTGYAVWLINANGSNQRTLVDNVNARSVKWSRKSGFIFYDDRNTLFKIKPDGSDQQIVYSFDTSDDVKHFDVSPDERYIVFGIGGEYVKEEIFLLKLPREMQ